MKDYPSIPQSIGTEFREIPNAYVFDKPDGSQTRWEWTRKRGFYKFGTKRRLFDATDWQFGRAIPLFMNTLSEGLEKIFREQGWDQVIVFAEYWGPSSFAGNHHNPDQTPFDSDDKMRVDLFDIAPHKQGILGPSDFVKMFGHLPCARFLGRFNWTRGFVERVWNNEIEGITFEGVVGKSGNGKNHDLIMAKAKTKAWIDKVKARYAPEEAEKIIKS